MGSQLVIESPAFDEIKKESGYATRDAIQLIWYALNDEILNRIKARWRWDDVAFAAGNFTASAGTWTVASGDHSFYRVARLYDQVMVWFDLTLTTTSAGMGTSLYITLPHGWALTSNNFNGFLHASDNITEIGYIVGNSDKLDLRRAAGSAWPSNVTDRLGVRGFFVGQLVA